MASYYTDAGDGPISERAMRQMLQGYRHDGATIEETGAGILVHLPHDPLRFYQRCS